MPLHENKHISFFLLMLYVVFAGAVCYFFVKYLLGIVAPLIIAYLLSCIISRPVNFLSKKTVLPKKPLTILFTLFILTAFGALIYLIGYLLILQGSELINALPDILTSIVADIELAMAPLNDLLASIPGFPQGGELTLSELLANMELPQISVSGAYSSLSSAISSVPYVLFTLVFVFVSTYYLTSERVKISAFVRKCLGRRIYSAVKQLRDFLFTSVFRWIKTQGILISITFVELLIAFSLLKQPHALLFAALIAIIDAFPILGVGTVLIPWAAIEVLTGDFAHGAILLLVYGIVLIVRNSIEPKILGIQLGLDPFVTLLSIYFGFVLAGFFGMFLLPLTVLSLIKLHEWGYLTGFKE